MKPILVTTAWRGVFFGYVPDDADLSAEVLALTNARNAIYWSSATGGFMGLASEGPAQGSRIGARSDIVLRGVTAVLPVTETAAKAWESAAVYRG